MICVHSMQHLVTEAASAAWPASEDATEATYHARRRVFAFPLTLVALAQSILCLEELRQTYPEITDCESLPLLAFAAGLAQAASLVATTAAFLALSWITRSKDRRTGEKFLERAAWLFVAEACSSAAKSATALALAPFFLMSLGKWCATAVVLWCLLPRPTAQLSCVMLGASCSFGGVKILDNTNVLTGTMDQSSTAWLQGAAMFTHAVLLLFMLGYVVVSCCAPGMQSDSPVARLDASGVGDTERGPELFGVAPTRPPALDIESQMMEIAAESPSAAHVSDRSSEERPTLPHQSVADDALAAHCDVLRLCKRSSLGSDNTQLPMTFCVSFHGSTPEASTTVTPNSARSARRPMASASDPEAHREDLIVESYGASEGNRLRLPSNFSCESSEDAAPVAAVTDDAIATLETDECRLLTSSSAVEGHRGHHVVNTNAARGDRSQAGTVFLPVTVEASVAGTSATVDSSLKEKAAGRRSALTTPSVSVELLREGSTITATLGSVQPADDDCMSACSVLSDDSSSMFTSAWSQFEDTGGSEGLADTLHLVASNFNGIWRCTCSDVSWTAAWAREFVICGRTVVLGDGRLSQLRMDGSRVLLKGGTLVRVGDRLLRFGKSNDTVIVYTKRDEC
eukprot:TRINITY_DN54272_c1_g1_i2.p1 TRINITY_DN54272_c1_g1~~TRINITY_DN54272_c1_g1_i2.p1  ORF type:complete len:628 (-),score=52.13 TRINITY_DN54272_c1_g1_i2:552-2435(-)